MTKEIEILDQKIGCDHPTYFVADIAANHDGDLDRAKSLIYLAAESGADAAKFQNFKAETIASDFGFRGLGGKQTHQAGWQESVYDVYDAAALPLEWTPVLRKTCQDANIDYFTAPYELSMVRELSPYVCAWKIGSGDITWHKHIEEIAKDGKPVLLATGASHINEVRDAVAVLSEHTDKLVLMQCNTNYTGSIDNFRFICLNVLRSYSREFPDVVLGLSDHTPGSVTVLGAVALGARVIEKHFTDDCAREGPDHKFSMEPENWRKMVEKTRTLELALGSEAKEIMGNEMETVVLQRRSIRATKSIRAGQVINEDCLIALRPCPTDAIPPNRENELIGTIARRDVQEGDYFRVEDID